MATLTLRSGATGATGVKNAPLTNVEIDDNFKNLNADIATRLLSSDYTASDILTKIKTVDGTGSGLDADLLDGLNAVSGATGASIVSRDSSGNFAAHTITAALTGNVTGNVTGNLSGNVTGNVTGDVTGDVTGNVTGDLTGNVTGDITGDTTGNHNGAVGNSTPSSGAFTTLSASNTLSIGGAAILASTLSLSGSNGTSGQFLKSRGSSTPPIWDDISISLISQVTDTLAYDNGGTGLSSPGANRNVLTSNGTSWDSVPLNIVAGDLSNDPSGIHPEDEQYGSAPIFAARAWARFDGTKDTTDTTSTSNTNRLIKGSGNVASILRNSIGNYTLTFRIALPTANFAAIASGFLTSGDAAIITTDAYTTSTVTINCVDASGAEADFSNVNIAIFG